MKNKSLRLLLIFLLIVLSFYFDGSSCADADAKGFRIVTLSPSIAEIICELGMCNFIVGVSEYTDSPKVLTKLPKVGSYDKPNLEKIVSLNPTIVFGERNLHYKVLKSLNELGIKAVGVDAISSIADIKMVYTVIGSELGIKQKAQKSFYRLIEAIKNLAKRLPNNLPRCLVIVWPNPLIVAGADSYIADLFSFMKIPYAGSTIKGAFPKINIETLIAINPQLIFVPCEHGQADLVKEVEDTFVKAGINLAKVKIVSVDADVFFRPGPKIKEAASIIVDTILNVWD